MIHKYYTQILMELHIIPILSFLCIAAVGSHATLTPELYWMETLPNATMPKSIRLSLPSNLGNGNGGMTGDVLTKKVVYADTKPLEYDYAASKTQLHDDPTSALFFLEKDMKLGHKITMYSLQSTNGARDEARSIPFSSGQLLEILHKFSVQPESEDAQMIEDTIKGCERKGIRGEEKYCATSLEDMIDYAKSTLGNNVKAISTEVKNGNYTNQKYVINAVTRVSTDDNALACHKKNYLYAVFYCHKTKATSPYIVSLTSDEGTKIEVVAICHKDTSGWNPKHLSFQVLNVKPGSIPICHFLPEDHIVWVRD